MRIVFSRDRPAQLDLLLRSLELNAPPEETRVIWLGTERRYQAGYGLIEGIGRMQMEFDRDLRSCVEECVDPTITFFCDDDVLYRPQADAVERLLAEPLMLTFSLRLGRENRDMAHPDDWAPGRGHWLWVWYYRERENFGFPGSVDGHIFRTEDVRELLGEEAFRTPTFVETVISLRCDGFKDRRPLMGCFPDQRLVGVPVNRVSHESSCRAGERHPQSTHHLNKRFLGGERIVLERLDFSAVAGCLYELSYVWG